MANLELDNDLKKYGKTKSKKIYFVVFIAILLGIGGYYFFLKDKKTQNSEISFVTHKVSKGDLSVTVMATGNLKPTNSVDVGIEVSGTIKEIYVDFNDQVQIGQVLAKLDTTKLEASLDSSKASLTIAKANLKESEVNLRSKKSTYDRVLKMYKNSGGKYPSVNEVDENKYSYESAQVAYEASKAKVEQASFDLKTSQENLGKAVVKSSIKGIVLNRAVEVGQTVAASMETPVLFTIAKDLTLMDLIVNIDEADVADIKKDLDVTFNVDAYPKETFKGKIKQVRLNPIESNGVITYETVVWVNNERLLLRPGMTASAQIITKQSVDKLIIPNTALRFKPKVQMEKKTSTMSLVQPPRRQSGETQAKELGKKEFASIFVLKENQPKRIRVKILETDGKSTTVESENLNIGDEVIVSQKSNNEK